VLTSGNEWIDDILTILHTVIRDAAAAGDLFAIFDPRVEAVNPDNYEQDMVKSKYSNL
jgi:hypothetical protein